MKKLNWCLVAGAVAVVARAQTNTPPTLPVAEFPLSQDALWSYAISIVSPVLVWLTAKWIPKLPKPVLPAITPLIGLGLGCALNALAGANLGWIDMAKAGALAVFIREVVNQSVTKRLAASDDDRAQG